VDLSLAHAYSAAKHLTGGAVGLIRVELTVDEIENETFYRKAFQAPVVLAAGRDALIFSQEAMHKPIATSNERVKALVRETVLDSSLEERDILTQVRLLIRRLLRVGHCSIERVSAIYSCDKRTLQRHLKLQGSSYQQLLDEERFEMALNYLRDTNISLTQVAMLVGFSDPSNLSRAFKKHFKKSPKQWRSEQGISGRASLPSRLRMF
jgi:AraC-like DNA-binding protein